MKIERINERFTADSRRVILQPFQLNEKRTKSIIQRVLKLTEQKVEQLLAEIKTGFEIRHRDFWNRVLDNFENISEYIEEENISDNRKLLIGAYFSKEYSIESAALFNPSIVPHPDQSGLDPGELRFIMSLRATGEGHISSIEFREGIISENNDVTMVIPTRFASLPNTKPKLFSLNEVSEVYSDPKLIELLNSELAAEFSYNDLKQYYYENKFRTYDKEIQFLLDYTNSNYDVNFTAVIPVSERVLFPLSNSESMGMEDVRFVKFINDDGTYKYYGTYTAYNGRTFRTQLIETVDFINYEIRTMTGNGVLDKGLALFPRKVSGMYFMISRQDGENLYIMKSDDLYNWDNAEKLMTPEYDWEFVQIGNCGSPLETDKGWLLITHAVGAFRKYVISAVLLKIDEPDKIIGRCEIPILSPDEDEREGYVPNVVYSCGSLVKDDEIILPYAMSDSASGFVKIRINELLDELVK